MSFKDTFKSFFANQFLLCVVYSLSNLRWFSHTNTNGFLSFLSVSLCLNLNQMEMTVLLTDEGEVRCEMTGEGFVTQVGQIVI